jgi:hypothetical protein
MNREAVQKLKNGHPYVPLKQTIHTTRQSRAELRGGVEKQTRESNRLPRYTLSWDTNHTLTNNSNRQTTNRNLLPVQDSWKTGLRAVGKAMCTALRRNMKEKGRNVSTRGWPPWRLVKWADSAVEMMGISGSSDWSLNEDPRTVSSLRTCVIVRLGLGSTVHVLIVVSKRSMSRGHRGEWKLQRPKPVFTFNTE